MAQFNLDEVTIVFFDQYRTLAVYDKSAGSKKIIGRFILKDRNSAASTPQPFALSIINGNELHITPPNIALPDPTIPRNGWDTFSFNALNEAADIWQDGAEIVIGMGDIRNGYNDDLGFSGLIRYALNDTTAKVYITCTTDNVIKILVQ